MLHTSPVICCDTYTTILAIGAWCHTCHLDCDPDNLPPWWLEMEIGWITRRKPDVVFVVNVENPSHSHYG